MQLFTSTNNGISPITSDNQTLRQRIDTDQATETTADDVRAQSNGLPWVPPEFFVSKGRDGQLYVKVVPAAIDDLARMAAQIGAEPDFNFNKDSDEARLVSDLTEAHKLEFECLNGISEFEAASFQSRCIDNAAYNAAFAAKQLVDAANRTERLSAPRNGEEPKDAAEDETVQKLWQNYLRSGRSHKILAMAAITAFDKVEFDYRSAAKRVLERQANTYWTERVRSAVTPQQAAERSNAGGLAILRSRMKAVA